MAFPFLAAGAGILGGLLAGSLFTNKTYKPTHNAGQLPGGALANKIKPPASVSITDTNGNSKYSVFRDVSGNIKFKINDKNLDIRPVNWRNPDKPNELETLYAKLATELGQLQRIRQNYEDIGALAPEMIPELQQRLGLINRRIDRFTESGFTEASSKINRLMSQSGQLKNGAMIQVAIMQANEKANRYLTSEIEKANIADALKNQLMQYTENNYKLGLGGLQAQAQNFNLALQQNQQRIDTEIQQNNQRLQQQQLYGNIATNLFNTGREQHLNAMALDQRRLADFNATNLQANIQNRNPLQEMGLNLLTSAVASGVGTLLKGGASAPAQVTGNEIANSVAPQLPVPWYRGTGRNWYEQSRIGNLNRYY